ncbi:AraC family transcriptional regulator [Antribacter gilvus]|uniref:AraC family transcriptional regulator n=1 Tax=Antribacter gilvus TaxID=2304675 RepID=UPI000F79EF8D|nr:AraC family transcriptional regulator [Antribacter gilvus]
MDVLSAFLEGPRARSAFVLRTLLDPPWCLRIQDEAPLTVVAVVRGTAWVIFDDGEQLALEPGDVGIFRGPDPYLVADHPATAPQVLIQPGGECTDLTGNSLMESGTLGVRTWGNSADGSSVLLCGTYQTDGEVSRRLLATLPRLAVARAATLRSPLVDLLAAEIPRDDPGQQVVLDRLLDLLLVSALRSWAARPDGEPPAWFRADADPVVGQALRLLHGDPAAPWTVEGLARSVGVSRALLSRRFHELAGEPPMTYLTSWRMALAADQLLDPSATVGGVGRTVGYESPFTFSTAFKRVYGKSPSAHRTAAKL